MKGAYARLGASSTAFAVDVAEVDELPADDLFDVLAPLFGPDGAEVVRTRSRPSWRTTRYARPWTVWVETHGGLVQHRLGRDEAAARTRAAVEEQAAERGRVAVTGPEDAAPSWASAPTWSQLGRAPGWQACTGCTAALQPGRVIELTTGRCARCTRITDRIARASWPTEPPPPLPHTVPKWAA